MAKSGQTGDVIEAAGTLVWRESPRGRELAVIHRGRHDDWTLPKGKLIPGEGWKEAAVRETAEETGCQVDLGDFAGCTCYPVRGVPKIVLFWHATLHAEDRFQPSDEVDQLVWLTIAEALEKLEYDNERKLVRSRM